MHRQFTLRGSRVLALGYKPLPEDASWHDWKQVSRKMCESDLNFAGVLVLSCPLKASSSQVYCSPSKIGPS
eukprot:38646_4